MYHVPKEDLLQALKESLQDLENLKLLSPNDLAIFDLKRKLKFQIAELERQLAKRDHQPQHSDGPKLAA